MLECSDRLLYGSPGWFCWLRSILTNDSLFLVELKLCQYNTHLWLMACFWSSVLALAMWRKVGCWAAVSVSILSLLVAALLIDYYLSRNYDTIEKSWKCDESMSVVFDLEFVRVSEAWLWQKCSLYSAVVLLPQRMWYISSLTSLWRPCEHGEGAIPV